MNRTQRPGRLGGLVAVGVAGALAVAAITAAALATGAAVPAGRVFALTFVGLLGRAGGAGGGTPGPGSCWSRDWSSAT
jgi:hypothetical protein